VVYEGVTNSFAWYAEAASKRAGIAYVALQGSRLPGRHEVFDGKESGLRSIVQSIYQKLETGSVQPDSDCIEWTRKYLADFESSSPDYMSSNGLLLQNPIAKFGKARNLQTFWRLLMFDLRCGPDRAPYRMGCALRYSLSNAQRTIKRWVRSKYIGQFFSNPPPSEQFYLYPLHFHPEASTSVRARYFVDEYPVVKNLAFSIPFGSWLYVKDHPSAVGLPTLDFYRRISRLPNVRLLAPGQNTKCLIRDSLGVITLTSTVGLEALIMKKPVWTLGEAFYDFHPGCRSIGWNQELTRCLEEHRDTQLSDSEAQRLVEAYYMATNPGTLPLDGESCRTATFAQLANEIANYAFSKRTSD